MVRIFHIGIGKMEFEKFGGFMEKEKEEGIRYMDVEKKGGRGIWMESKGRERSLQ